MPEERVPSPSEVFEVFANMPPIQLLFLALSAATWLIGGNIVIARHYRRMGKSSGSGFRSFAFSWKDFEAQEWLVLAGLAVVSLTFCAIAVSLNSR